jgi:hypothetical protein
VSSLSQLLVCPYKANYAQTCRQLGNPTMIDRFIDI